jgi:archaellum biogenesis protein FlaJ (TadC family)
MTVPELLFFEAFPLVALLYLLEKNNGLAYFKNWNAEKRLRISGLFLMFGYIIPIVFMLVDAVTLFWQSPIDQDFLTLFSVAAGCLLMLGGLIIFVGVATIHHRRRIETTLNIPTKRDRL